MFSRSRTCSTAVVVAFVLVTLPVLAYSFVQRVPHQQQTKIIASTSLAAEKANDDNHVETGRRSFLGIVGGLSLVLTAPGAASAGIDVSGLRSEGGGGGNSAIASQLKAFDGSASTRVQEIKAASAAPVRSEAAKPLAGTAASSSGATWALTTSPRLSKLGLGERYRFQDNLQGPVSTAVGSPRFVSATFEFPSDWLQLDRNTGGVQYVDQRNGDKLYLLRATLPTTGDDNNANLASVAKQWFGKALFDPQGSIVRSGTNVEDYKVSSISVNECANNMCATSRRLGVKYATVTGNGLRVERRGLVQAVQVGSDVYMLMTASNAVKFEKQGLERETVEKIVDSFRLEAM